MIPTQFPRSFQDPLYAQLARAAEAAYQLPTGILDAIRTQGERSNAGQVSPAGAQTPYQFIPSTRQGMINNYGVDAWNSPTDSTRAAALLLQENHRRFGNWNDAVAAYHGGLKRRNWGPRTQAYLRRVGSFDNGDSSMPLGPSLYPPTYGAEGTTDPLAAMPTDQTENPTMPVPVPGYTGPSVPVQGGDPAVAKKRGGGGLFGAIGRTLGNIFMPDPNSLYAAALRGGIWDARQNQADYQAGQRLQTLNEEEKYLKLRQLMTKGEYQIVGNNVLHIPADGGPAEFVQTPQTTTDKERLFYAWENEKNPQVKDMLQRILLQSNAPAVLQSHEKVAGIRAANKTAKPPTQPKPPARFILDN